MARGLTFTAVGLIVLIALVLVHPTCCATSTCSASSCGNIHNISFPFRLSTDPENCGDPWYEYELSCENNRTVLYKFGGKYYVQEISYNNYTIRIVDSGIQKNNYFSTPNYSLYRYKFSSQYSVSATYQRKGTVPERYPELSRSLVWMSSEKPVNSPLYLDTSTCNYNDNSSSISDSKRYRYVTVGITNASQVEDSCQVEKMFLTSWPINNDDPNISCTDVLNELAYGFELSWLGSGCYLDDANHVRCDDSTGVLDLILGILRGLGYVFAESAHWWDAISGVSLDSLIFHLETKIVLGIPCMVAFLIYKWRKRHLSMYDAIEEFLQSQINLMPIRYSYSEIRKMSKGFKDRLGEGGYGIVYKGKLQSGPLVAIKMLGNSKANGQDFINEVATIGRIYHVNVVQLIGFCAEGSKRALIYEYMSNGSLEKYIFSREESILLSIEKTYEISLGVARGIEYLHRGCEMQILHFDIKPHNILLDENFIPKVSDFGLAKLYPANNSIVSLTAARGTLGYIAPELFYKNIGGVSYKADVYSFGMLLLEMASRRKNMNAFADHSSQIYFPTWVYDQFSKGKDIEIEDATEEEKKIAKKMIIVALWCIQMKPSDRPSMNKVVEMLEGEVECSQQMPSKPFLSSSPGRSTGDVGDNLNSTSSSFQSGESSQSAKL
ncbi:LEAF RUST 10 DISEASE-RESISTANCE LOCUS RECEPTOR-LIKE PROTEIN KINASE-like 2.4 isoform X2 [Quercus robur]|uniref:LEAF RUST 10 DISEASE-RESISTANCE LOCUS RECEPTOR-LIKE PROTEIN KINASE-like 2.4 isoform X2 n=1 Tax=Quercus robur TaxID=38942 RepID=UPI00216159FF|nr:LEAF RUST 10 DISEASE-RESISTANCE LOCUS RECEPTOR-LIKE PROTEIN KINASE-like 2.4 isoform X2 [Quercus robur]